MSYRVEHVCKEGIVDFSRLVVVVMHEQDDVYYKKGSYKKGNDYGSYFPSKNLWITLLFREKRL